MISVVNFHTGSDRRRVPFSLLRVFPKWSPSMATVMIDDGNQVSRWGRKRHHLRICIVSFRFLRLLQRSARSPKAPRCAALYSQTNLYRSLVSSSSYFRGGRTIRLLLVVLFLSLASFICLFFYDPGKLDGFSNSGTFFFSSSCSFASSCTVDASSFIH